MGQPLAIGDLHVREGCRKGGILRAASVNAKTDFSCALPHVAYPHLRKKNAILRTLDAVVIFSAVEPVPHCPNVRRDRSRSPVRIPVVRYNTAKVLELRVLILNRPLQPVFAVQIHDDAALIEAVVRTGEICFHHKGEEFFFCLHLENRRIVVAEMVVSPLPRPGVKSCVSEIRQSQEEVR